jgi:hypothetical protein
MRRWRIARPRNRYVRDKGLGWALQVLFDDHGQVRPPVFRCYVWALADGKTVYEGPERPGQGLAGQDAKRFVESYRAAMTAQQSGLWGVLQRNSLKEGCDHQSSLRDVLTDLRHLARTHGLDFDKAAQGSAEVFAEELALSAGDYLTMPLRQ